ncbi:MAG: FUSC family protein [Mycobacterium sp.]
MSTHSTEEGGMRPAELRERTLNWLIGSDPGLLRLHTTIRTTVTLVAVLVALTLLTKVTGGPVTVAMLGVVIAMQAAMAVNDPDPRQQKITMLLLPVSASAAVTVAALLASHKTVSEVAFVAVIFVAAYVRRFGSRGMALGMVAFMAYFFALFLGAQVAEVPKLVGAIVIGTAGSLLIRSYLMPDRPERVLRYTVWALWLRIAAVIDLSAEALRSGGYDDRLRRRMRRRITQLNETVVMVEDQLASGVEGLWPGIDDDVLILRLFDAELGVERLAVACARAGVVDAGARALLTASLTELSAASSGPSDENLARSIALAEEVMHRTVDTSAEVRSVAFAVLGMGTAITEMRALVREVDTAAPDVVAEDDATEPFGIGDDLGSDDDAQEADQGLNPATRQAIQASIAGGLAIVAGELVSPARWYWAVITAFVVFAGTTSRGEILTRGWQRLFGTILGVPAGVLVAALVSGHQVVALVLIFACLFLGFYFQKVSYGVMMFCITTMLALLYGLMGQFSVGVLVLRLEETAVGTVIGVAVAALVLPTKTLATARIDAETFLGTLSEVVAASVAGDGSGATELARRLHRELHALRLSAKPLTAGIFGIGGRGSVQRAMRLLTVCDHHARVLARAAETAPGPMPPRLAELLGQAGTVIGHNIAALMEGESAIMVAAIESLDAAEVLVSGPRQHRALHALRAIDGAVFNLAMEAGQTAVA